MSGLADGHKYLVFLELQSKWSRKQDEKVAESQPLLSQAPASISWYTSQGALQRVHFGSDGRRRLDSFVATHSIVQGTLEGLRRIISEYFHFSSACNEGFSPVSLKGNSITNCRAGH